MPAIATRCVACDHAAPERQAAVLMPFIAQRALLWTPCEITPEWGLRSIPLGHAQALCNTLHCPACGLVFADLRFDDAEMSRLYQDYRGDSYTAERERWEPGYAERNARLVAGDAHLPAVEAFLTPWLPTRPRILDWGGDSGINTPLRDQAAVHHVLDISGRPTLPGVLAITAEQARAEHHDLIVLSNVLEHVPYPFVLLSEVAAVLRPGARLYVEVPHEALMRDAQHDANAWRRKRHWHEHVNFFSASSLHTLCDRAGLTLLAETCVPVPGGTAEQLALVLERV